MIRSSGCTPSRRGANWGSARAASRRAVTSRSYRSPASGPPTACLTTAGVPSNSADHTRDRGLLLIPRTLRCLPSTSSSMGILRHGFITLGWPNGYRSRGEGGRGVRGVLRGHPSRGVRAGAVPPGGHDRARLPEVPGGARDRPGVHRHDGRLPDVAADRQGRLPPALPAAGAVPRRAAGRVRHDRRVLGVEREPDGVAAVADRRAGDRPPVRAGVPGRVPRPRAQHPRGGLLPARHVGRRAVHHGVRAAPGGEGLPDHGRRPWQQQGRDPAGRAGAGRPLRPSGAAGLPAVRQGRGRHRDGAGPGLVAARGQAGAGR